MMQVIPKFAAASPINILNVGTVDGNIHAGAKMLRNITDTYFNRYRVMSCNRRSVRPTLDLILVRTATKRRGGPPILYA